MVLFTILKAWAAEDNLQLNPRKTRELIVYRRRAGSSAPLDPFIPGATRVTSMRVIGVVLSFNLSLQWAITWMRPFPPAPLPSRFRHFVYRHFVYYCIPACSTVIHPTSVSTNHYFRQFQLLFTLWFLFVNPTFTDTMIIQNIQLASIVS